MSDANDHFVVLQNAVVARLEATDPHVPAPVSANGKAVPYFSEQKGDIVQAIQKAVSAIGIYAIVLTPTARMADENAPTLGMDASVLVQVQETPLSNQGNNGTKIPALRLVSFIMRRLQNFSPNIYGTGPMGQRLRLDRKPFVLVRDESPLTYNVAASVRIDLSAALSS